MSAWISWLVAGAIGGLIGFTLGFLAIAIWVARAARNPGPDDDPRL